ncbi:MAG: D-alanyl-D-alanine carboxypeptidase/D-alanyl-D-alanine-endopeptidase [Phycisphaerae bacterium]|nr:D-alanyl-D-alanine carboxypeptidase/D-alanyl-D-alanine-endopeptidase [Phycisphaerae bacterium]
MKMAHSHRHLGNKGILLALYLAVLLAGGAAFGQDAKLQAKLDKLLKNREVYPWKVSVLAVEVKTGRPIFASRETRPLIPASNMKLVVTAAALSRWGADYEFSTLLARRGKDIVVIGSGDPGFADPLRSVKYGRDPTSVFREWARILKNAGLSKAGDIIIDDSIFDDAFVHPDWTKDQLREKYTPPSGGLNLWENWVWVYKHSRDSQKNLKLQVGPAAANEKESKQVPLAHRRVSISGGPKAARQRAGGLAVPPGQKGWVKPADPGVFFGSVFRAVLANEGISVSGQVVRQKLSDAEGKLDKQVVILARAGTKLTSIIRRTNVFSRALYAECLIKRLGKDASGAGNWKNGAAAVGRFLTGKEVGARPEEFTIADGSGLSRNNLLSPTALVAVLKYMAKHPDAETFRNSLAVWGQSGTLKWRSSKSVLAGRVFAKTGTINGVRSLSGYLRTKRGKLIAFSILLNEVPRKKGQRAWKLREDICRLLVNY